jgi:hypothetical protein
MPILEDGDVASAGGDSTEKGLTGDNVIVHLQDDNGDNMNQDHHQLVAATATEGSDGPLFLSVTKIASGLDNNDHQRSNDNGDNNGPPQ